MQSANASNTTTANLDEAESARNILASMLTLGHLLTVNPREDIRAWHRAHLSLGEAFALLWQQDDQGGVVERNEHTGARFLAAHLVDLLLAGRIKLLWDAPEGKKKQLSFMVVSTEPVSVEATTIFLQELYTQQEKRRVVKKKKYAKSIYKFLDEHCDDSSKEEIGGRLEKDTFAGLVERGILTKEKQKAWVFFLETIYPTGDPTPEALLVQDLRALLNQEIPSNSHLELLLKLIGKTTKVFTQNEEEANPMAKQMRQRFLQDGYYTLLGAAPIGNETKEESDATLWRLGNDEKYVEDSPFLADEEHSLRWKMDVDEGVMS